MNRKFKEWWSTIPPISTIWTTSSHWTQIKLEIHLLACDRHKNYGRVKLHIWFLFTAQVPKSPSEYIRKSFTEWWQWWVI